MEIDWRMEEETPGVGTGDNLRLWAYDGEAYIEVENPWDGDTQTGFGRSGSIKITKEQARALAAELLKYADS